MLKQMKAAVDAWRIALAKAVEAEDAVASAYSAFPDGKGPAPGPAIQSFARSLRIKANRLLTTALLIELAFGSLELLPVLPNPEEIFCIGLLNHNQN